MATGSIHYDNSRVIKDALYRLKKNISEPITIIGGGNRQGADKFIKKYALQFDFDYKEYPPFHCPWNIHCPLPKMLYNKAFHTKHIYSRNKYLVKNIHGALLFSNEPTLPSYLEALIKDLTKKTITYKLFND